MVDYYAVLGVAPGADSEVIAAAYRAAAKKYHPDKYPEGPQRLQAQERMKALTEAWGVLKDPERRQKYDAQRPRTSGQGPSSLPFDVAEVAGRVSTRLGQGVRVAQASQDFVQQIAAIFGGKK